MIRNTMLGLSLLALSGASAFAAPMAKHNTPNKIVAQAPAADGTAPKDAKDTKKTKHTKKAKDATKGDVKADAPKADAPATK
ncbi:MAG TPA: hypothetical protein VH374_03170 [Polyangia bacterium]|jgi:hypothetical protein|nr:hypothetical protein [Polyangia bacterium]